MMLSTDFEVPLHKCIIFMCYQLKFIIKTNLATRKNAGDRGKHKDNLFEEQKFFTKASSGCVFMPQYYTQIAIHDLPNHRWLDAS